ncbi:unnamed protein product, partial [Polarella glacialis]
NETFILAAEDTRYDLPTTELIARHWQHAGKPAPFFSQGSLEGFTSLVCSDKAHRELDGSSERVSTNNNSKTNNRK